MDVREVIVAGWWRGWKLCSELGSFGSTVNSETFIYHKRKILVCNTKVGCRYNFFLCSRKFFVAQQNFLDRKIILAIRNK